MPRGLTAEQKTLLAARVRRPAYFVKLELDSETLRLWNGDGDATVLEATWRGVGEFGVIQGIESNRSLRAESVSMALGGVPAQYITGGAIAAARSERIQGRPLTIYLGFCDLDTGAPLHDPTVIWSGFADVLGFQLGETVTASLDAEHFSSHLRRSNGARMTTESHNQRLDYPDPPDLFFEPQDRTAGVAKPVV